MTHRHLSGSADSRLAGHGKSASCSGSGSLFLRRSDAVLERLPELPRHAISFPA
jgi:hypothetical protein